MKHCSVKGEQPGGDGVFIKTYGCQMNEYDSEKMFQLLSDRYRPVQQLEQAAVVLVNTCSVREKAAGKLYSLLGRLRKVKQARPELVIGVAGCLAQQEGVAILKRSGVVDFVVGTHNISLIPSLVKAAQSGIRNQVAVDYRDEWEELPAQLDALPGIVEAQPGPSFGAFYSPVRAMVAIQRGCNKRCSFCVVPTTRGPEVSRNAEEVLREIRLKVRLGAREVMLLGQTVNSYGRDLSPRWRFDQLVKEVAAIDGLERIRFISPHPAEVRPEFIELYREVDKLCPNIHLPLQSGSDRILKLMNRNYRTARYLEIVEQLRAVRPDISITSDFIVGFPTESDADFRETLELVRRVHYVSSYSFKYSRRPNTSAMTHYDSAAEVPDSVADGRLRELQLLQQEISMEINAKSVGQLVQVLVEGRSNNISSLMRGRSPHNVPVEIVPGSISADSVPEELGVPEESGVTEESGAVDRAGAVAELRGSGQLGELVDIKVSHSSAFGLRGVVQVANLKA